MEDSKHPFLLGVDGGGSTCRVALLHGGQRSEVSLGRANVSSDFDGAIRAITGGLEAVAAKAGLTTDALADIPAHLGLAGAVSPEITRKVKEALPLTRAGVSDDRVTTLVGALGTRDGAVAGIGTGSFLARQSGMVRRLIGGYGLVLGDEASAAWLGRSLFARALQVLDGLESPSPLATGLLAEFGNAPGALIAFAQAATPQDFGAYAPRIAEAALAGDANGRALMEAGADYITRGLAALGWAPGEALCLIGGVAGRYLDHLAPAIAGSVTEPAGTGLDGALVLAGQIGAVTE